jgi:hypothetical protein
MKRTTLIAAATAFVALAGAASAFAAGTTQNFSAQTVRGEAQEIAVPTLSGQSRDDVRQELAAAVRGRTLVYGEASVAPQQVFTLSRAVVQAETREALRLGVVGANEAEVFTATPAQRESIRLAGLRALETNLAQKR